MRPKSRPARPHAPVLGPAHAHAPLRNIETPWLLKLSDRVQQRATAYGRALVFPRLPYSSRSLSPPRWRKNSHPGSTFSRSEVLIRRSSASESSHKRAVHPAVPMSLSRMKQRTSALHAESILLVFNVWLASSGQTTLDTKS